jgi:hypothetical protein
MSVWSLPPSGLEPAEAVAGSPAPAAVSTARRPEPVRWLADRLPPLLAATAVLVSALVFSFWWNVHVDHATVWYEPADLWRTMLAAVRLDHGQLGSLYTNGTNLVSFPGAAVLLAPAAAVISAIHAPLGPPIGTTTDTAAWVVALPYIVVVSTSVLFAADRLARRLGASVGKRVVLALAGGVALWNVVPYWGHPEDCVAVALLLFGVDAAASGRTWRSAWLVGLGLAVQPLIVLAVPVLVVTAAGWRRAVGWLLRAALPPAVAVGAALAANWSATWYQVVDQPNWPTIDRPTPWLGLAPHLTTQTVAAGPGRSIAVGLALLAAVPAWRAWRRAEERFAQQLRGPDAAPWSADGLTAVVWWVAVALALRCAFESVMVSYYIWPGIAVGLLAASTAWWRLVPTVTVGVGLTLFCNVWWRGEWSWWTVIVLGLTLLLTTAHPTNEPGRTVSARGSATRAEPVGSPSA